MTTDREQGGGEPVVTRADREAAWIALFGEPKHREGSDFSEWCASGVLVHPRSWDKAKALEPIAAGYALARKSGYEQALARISELEGALEACAGEFDNQAEIHRLNCNGPADAGKEAAFAECAAYVRERMKP